jgi:murein DD-endopeptidase MepM/ murein hydrolase activator NlpD
LVRCALVCATGRRPGPVPRRCGISSFWKEEDPQFPGAGLAQLYLSRLADLPLSTRHLTHGLVLLIAAVVAAVGGVTAAQRAEAEAALVRAWSATLSATPTFRREEWALRARALPSTEGAVPDYRRDDESAPPVPQTRTTVLTYETRAGDSTYALALRFGVSVQSIVWANDLEDADHLPIGAPIVVPPTTGVLHTVAPGETLNGLASYFDVEPATILAYTPNGLSNANLLVAGRRIMIPGGRMPPPVRPVYQPPAAAVAAAPPTPAPAPTAEVPVETVASAAPPIAPAPPAPGTSAVLAPISGPVGVGLGNFVWPTYGPIFTYFGETGPLWTDPHTGIDISPPYGSPVYAADGGVVVEQQWLTWSYGWYLIIDHGNGYKTRYAHLSAFVASLGQKVARGQLIGRVGNTGKATGPHLHFEIILGKTPVNPLRYLP